MTAPELPAETMAEACPDFTSSKQTRMELSFFRRMAWPGWSCISTTSEACAHVDGKGRASAQARQLRAHRGLGADQQRPGSPYALR